MSGVHPLLVRRMRTQLALHDAAWAPVEAPPNPPSRGPQQRATPPQLQEPRAAVARAQSPLRTQTPPRARQALFQRLSQPRPAPILQPDAVTAPHREIVAHTVASTQRRRVAEGQAPTQARLDYLAAGGSTRRHSQAAAPEHQVMTSSPGASAAHFARSRTPPPPRASPQRALTCTGGAFNRKQASPLALSAARAQTPPPPRPRSAPGVRRSLLDGGWSWGSLSARSISGATIAADTQRRVAQHVERMAAARAGREARGRAGGIDARWDSAAARQKVLPWGATR